MAYDPEARRQSNSALTIGLIALGLLGAGTVAYFVTRPADVPPTTIVNTTSPAPRTQIIDRTVQQPVVVHDSAPNVVVPATKPDVVIVQPATRPATSSSTTTTSSTVIRNVPVQREPAAAPRTSTTNNTTVNVTAPTAAPADTATTEPATTDSTTTTSTTDSGNQ